MIKHLHDITGASHNIHSNSWIGTNSVLGTEQFLSNAIHRSDVNVS